MPDLKERFSLTDRIESPELWTEALRRATTLDATSRAVSSQQDRRKRAAAALVAFAVFAGAAVFAWNLWHPELAPRPRPEPAVDLASELPIGWSELPAPPEIRSGAATAWTGSQLLVWGGYEYTGFSDDSSQDDGFVYDARSRTWSPLPDTPLEGRSDPAFVWTGDELLIWGGRSEGGGSNASFFADGAAYDPSSRTWRSLPDAPIDARASFSVWTGSEFVVWGSTDRTARRLDGAAYNPATDRWRPMAEAPVNITDGSAIWSGDEMLVVGAALDGNNHAETRTTIGEAYDPETDVWHELPASDLSPQAMTAAWLDDELVAWDYDLASEAYDPGVDRWRPLAGVPLEFSECRPESVSTSRIVVGDFCGGTVVLTAEEQTWRQAPLPPCCSCCRTTELVAAGDVVFSMSHAIAIESLEAADRRMFVYNPRAVTNPDPTAAGTEPDPFFPATERDGDLLRMSVTFPDGSEATLVFPGELELEELGVQPDVTYLFRGRYQGPILFLHGREAPIGDFVDTSGGSTLVNTSEGGIEVWPAKAGERTDARAWIRSELRTWSVLVPIENRADAAPVTAALELRESETGFPFVIATGEAELARGFGEAGGPQLAFGDSRPEADIVSQLDSTIFLGLSRCGGFETEVSSDYGAICLGDGSVFASIYGDREFVASVIDGLRVEFRPA